MTPTTEVDLSAEPTVSPIFQPTFSPTSSPTCNTTSKFPDDNVVRIEFWPRCDSRTWWSLTESGSGASVTDEVSNDCSIRIEINNNCYTFELYDPGYEILAGAVHYGHPSFVLYLNDVLITLNNQTIDQTWYIGTPQECVYFCTDLINPSNISLLH